MRPVLFLPSQVASVDKNNPRPADILETVVPVKPTEQGSRCGRGRGKGRGKGRGGKGRGRGRGKGKKTYDEEEQEEEEHDDNNEDGDDAGEAEEGGAAKRKTAKTKTPKAKAKAAVKEKKTRKPKSKSAAKPAKESSKAAPKKHPRTQANRDGVDAGDDCPTTLKKKKATEVAVSESPKEVPTKRTRRGKKTEDAETTKAAEPSNKDEKPSSSNDKPKIPKRKAKDLDEKTRHQARRSQRIQPATSSACQENPARTTKLRRQH